VNWLKNMLRRWLGIDTLDQRIGLQEEACSERADDMHGVLVTLDGLEELCGELERRTSRP